MKDETWKIEYKQWKKLKPYQIKLIDEFPKTQSQACLLYSMWREWMNIKKLNLSENTDVSNSWIDPWDN